MIFLEKKYSNPTCESIKFDSRVGSRFGHIGLCLNWIRSNLIKFFRINKLIIQIDPNFKWIGLDQRIGCKLSSLITTWETCVCGN